VRPSTPYEEDGAYLWQWFQGAFISKTRGLEYGLPPTDILEDDPILIQKIGNGGADIFILATDDVKLFRLAKNRFPDQWLWRVSPLQYLQTNTYLIENLGKDADYDEALSDLFYQEFGKRTTIELLVDKGSVESYLNKYFEAPGGVYWQTVGIPWRADIKRSNLEKKPRHGQIEVPELKSMREAGWPLSFMGREDYQLYRQSCRSK